MNITPAEAASGDSIVFGGERSRRQGFFIGEQIWFIPTYIL